MTYHGVVRVLSDRHWAMCDELAVCGAGLDEDEALLDLTNGIKLLLSSCAELGFPLEVLSCPVARRRDDVEFTLEVTE